MRSTWAWMRSRARAGVATFAIMRSVGGGEDGGKRGSGGSRAAIQFEGDIAEAEERAYHFHRAVAANTGDIAKERVHLGDGAIAIEANGAEDAKAGAAHDTTGAVAAGECECDVIDAVRTAHLAHGEAHPADDTFGEQAGEVGVARRIKSPGGLADADARADEAFDAAVDGGPVEEWHVALFVGSGGQALGCNWVPWVAWLAGGASSRYTRRSRG